MHRPERVLAVSAAAFVLTLSLASAVPAPTPAAVPSPGPTPRPVTVLEAGFCGCADAADLNHGDLTAWTVFQLGRESVGKCEDFCGRGARHFTLTPYSSQRGGGGRRVRALCRCYKNLRVGECYAGEETSTRVHCVQRDENVVEHSEHDMDMMAKVRGGFDKVPEHDDSDNGDDDSDEVQYSKVNGEVVAVSHDDHDHHHHHRPDSSPDEDDGSVKTESSHGGGHGEEAAAGLVAVVLGLLALLCIAMLGAKSMMDSRAEAKKQDVADRIAAAARATTGEAKPQPQPSAPQTLSPLGLGLGAGGKRVEDIIDGGEEERKKRHKRLMSLSAGPFVFEKD